MISEDTKALIQMNAKLARIMAIKIEVDSMKAANYERMQNDEALAYDEKAFYYQAIEVSRIAKEIENIGKDETE